MRKLNAAIGRVLLLALLVAGLSSCGGSTAPLDPIQLRSLLTQELLIISTGIERQDPLLASQPLDNDFHMDDNVAIRYQDSAWGGPDVKGPAPFLAFLNKVFGLHANIVMTLELSDVQQTGDLATASVHVVWNSTRTDNVPPGHYTADDHDYFFFRRRAEGWRLLRWQETPAPPPPFE